MLTFFRSLCHGLSLERSIYLWTFCSDKNTSNSYNVSLGPGTLSHTPHTGRWLSCFIVSLNNTDTSCPEHWMGGWKSCWITGHIEISHVVCTMFIAWTKTKINQCNARQSPIYDVVVVLLLHTHAPGSPTGCAVVHCCGGDVVIWPQLQHQFLIRASRRHNEGSSTCCSIKYNNCHSVNNDMITLIDIHLKKCFLHPYVEVSK